MHCRNPIQEELMWILLYDDNISLVCDDMDCPRTPVTLMDTTFTNRGVTISTKKTKVLIVERDAETQAGHTILGLP